LRWLDPERDKGGQKYETIRSGLIRIFVGKEIPTTGLTTQEVKDLREKTFGVMGEMIKRNR